MFIGFVAALAAIERGPIGRAHLCLLFCAWQQNCGSCQTSLDDRATAACRDFCLAVLSRFIGGDVLA